jgi:hypothetical protein
MQCGGGYDDSGYEDDATQLQPPPEHLEVKECQGGKKKSTYGGINCERYGPGDEDVEEGDGSQAEAGCGGVADKETHVQIDKEVFKGGLDNIRVTVQNAGIVGGGDGSEETDSPNKRELRFVLVTTIDINTAKAEAEQRNKENKEEQIRMLKERLRKLELENEAQKRHKNDGKQRGGKYERQCPEYAGGPYSIYDTVHQMHCKQQFLVN